MLDHTKLQKAYDLASKLNSDNRKVWLDVSFAFYSDNSKAQCLSISHEDSQGYFFSHEFTDIDLLIKKLNELTNPENPLVSYDVCDHDFDAVGVGLNNDFFCSKCGWLYC